MIDNEDDDNDSKNDGERSADEPRFGDRFPDPRAGIADLRLLDVIAIAGAGAGANGEFEWAGQRRLELSLDELSRLARELGTVGLVQWVELMKRIPPASAR